MYFNASHSVIPICVNVFHTASNVHKMKAMFTYDIFVCTGKNEGTSQGRTSGLRGRQL